MSIRHAVTICQLVVILQLTSGVAPAGQRTLRSLGAVGDGVTDDRAAIEAALIQAAGAEIDGEHATYAVHGTIVVPNDVQLRNAKFVQTMEPVDVSEYIPSTRGAGELQVEPPDALRGMVGSLPRLRPDGVAISSADVVLSAEQAENLLRSVSLNTLEITGAPNNPVSVRLEQVTINRGKHPQTGHDNCAGIFIMHASPVVMNEIEVTGNGKGCGVSLRNCSQVQLRRLNIHDMNWAPYLGDPVFELASAKSIKEDFGWNDFPLYSFDRGLGTFVRRRVREQMFVTDSTDVQLLDSKIERLQTKIGDQLYPLQADGVTMTDITNLVVKNCQFSTVWEGIDLTGGMCDGIVVENCTATDTLTFGFKLAHPKRNAKLINCTASRAGLAGFVMEPEVENIEFIDCRALETGASGYWIREDGQPQAGIQGFRLGTNPALSTPNRVTFQRCAALNTSFPNTMAIGFCCEGGIDPAERQIRAVNCTVVGAAERDFQGLVVE